MLKWKITQPSQPNNLIHYYLETTTGPNYEKLDISDSINLYKLMLVVLTKLDR